MRVAVGVEMVSDGGVIVQGLQSRTGGYGAAETALRADRLLVGRQVFVDTAVTLVLERSATVLELQPRNVACATHARSV